MFRKIVRKFREISILISIRFRRSILTEFRGRHITSSMLLKGEIVPSGRKTVQTYSHGSPTSSWILMYSESQQLVGHGIYDYLLSHKVIFLEFHRFFAANYRNESKDFSEAETGSRMEK